MESTYVTPTHATNDRISPNAREKKKNYDRLTVNARNVGFLLCTKTLKSDNDSNQFCYEYVTQIT